jgi:hypothetical protein
MVMRTLAILTLFTCGLAALYPGPFALAATSDIYINDVATVTLAKHEKNNSVMPTLGNRRDVLYSLRALQTKQIQTLASLDHLPDFKLKNATLVADRKEARLRRQFYDQVIFSVDTKWTSLPLREFLEKEFISRAQNDIAADDRDDQIAADPLWKFYTYLSVAIRDLPEPREDLIAFIQGYVAFSSISSPKAPAAYVAQRAYSNGIVSQGARQRNEDELGDGVERLVRARGLDKDRKRTAGAKSSAIELRMHLNLAPNLAPDFTQEPAAEDAPASALKAKATPPAMPGPEARPASRIN